MARGPRELRGGRRGEIKATTRFWFGSPFLFERVDQLNQFTEVIEYETHEVYALLLLHHCVEYPTNNESSITILLGEKA